MSFALLSEVSVEQRPKESKGEGVPEQSKYSQEEDAVIGDIADEEGKVSLVHRPRSSCRQMSFVIVSRFPRVPQRARFLWL